MLERRRGNSKWEARLNAVVDALMQADLLKQRLSAQLRDMREAMAQDEQGAALMQALRGTNMNDDDFADAYFEDKYG